MIMQNLPIQKIVVGAVALIGLYGVIHFGGLSQGAVRESEAVQALESKAKTDAEAQAQFDEYQAHAKIKYSDVRTFKSQPQQAKGRTTQQMVDDIKKIEAAPIGR